MGKVSHGNEMEKQTLREQGSWAI